MSDEGKIYVRWLDERTSIRYNGEKAVIGRSRRSSFAEETGNRWLKVPGAERVEGCARELSRRKVGADGCAVIALEQISRVEPRATPLYGGVAF